MMNKPIASGANTPLHGAVSVATALITSRNSAVATISSTSAAPLEIAGTLTEHLGKPVIYAGDDLKAWAAQVRAFMPGWLVRDLEIMFQHFLHNGLLATQAEIDELTVLLGHAPRSYEAFVKEVLPV